MNAIRAYSNHTRSSNEANSHAAAAIGAWCLVPGARSQLPVASCLDPLAVTSYELRGDAIQFAVALLRFSGCHRLALARACNVGSM